MRPIARSTVVRVSAVALALGLTACAASAPSVGEAASDAAFATCGAASITVDRRTRYQAPIAGFLEDARTSGCSYGWVQVASAPQAGRESADDEAGAIEVARDFIDAFALSWRLQPEADDPSLPANGLRVTLLAPNDALAAAQTDAPHYR